MAVDASISRLHVATGGNRYVPLTPRLMPSALRPHLQAFLGFTRTAARIVENPLVAAPEKRRRLEALEAALDGTDSDGDDDDLARTGRALRDSLLATGVPFEPARHLLQAFVKDAMGVRFRSWSDLLMYYRYSAAPVGRYLLALTGEDDPRAGPAADALCMALQLLKRVRDAKWDYAERGRVYLPEDWLRDALITPNRLNSAAAQGQVRAVLDRALDGVDRLLLDARPLPSALRSLRYRIDAAVILCLAAQWARHLRRRDPLAHRLRLGLWPQARCAFGGLLAALSGRR